MPELTSAPVETAIASSDEIYFNDVSETPDALNRITWANAIQGLATESYAEGLAADVLFVDDYATLQDAFDAFKVSTAGKLIFSSNTTYTVTASLQMDAFVDKVVEGNGATLNLSGAGAINCLELTGVWSNSVIQNLSFTTSNPGATHKAIYWTSNVNKTAVINCYFWGMSYAVEYGGTLNNYILGCKTVECFIAGFYMSGEYCTVSDCQFYGNVSGAECVGIFISGGNNVIANSQILFGEIGIQLETAGNSDHGVITGCLINHNRQAGIFINGSLFGQVITGNEIAANGSGTQTDLGSAPQDNSFGIYAKSVTGLVITDNIFLRNHFSLAVEGITLSNIANNLFIGDNTVTINHFKEVGGTNVSYSFKDNIVDNLLTGGAEPIIGTGATMSGNRRDGALNEAFRVASDITRTSATPANITGMTTPYLLAGRTYEGRLTVLCSESSAADGLRLDFDGGTATATDFRAMGTVADTVSVRPLAMTSAIATDFVDTTTTGDAIAVIDFTITVNAAGTFIPRYAQEAAGGGTLTVYRGTSLVIKDITA